jgi:hypothetical protein
MRFFALLKMTKMCWGMNMKFDYGNKSSRNITGLRYTAAVEITGAQVTHMCRAWL